MNPDLVINHVIKHLFDETMVLLGRTIPAYYKEQSVDLF